jgi:hypothetical protein
MLEDASTGARWTLAGAMIGSLLLLGAVALWWPSADPVSQEVALPGPWEPPTAATLPVFSSAPAVPVATTSPARTRSATKRPAATRPPTTRPTATRPPSKRPAPEPTTGPNLSLRADGDADGSTKAEGTRFNDVRDGDLSSFWSPTRTTGEISVKWPVPVKLSRIEIREAPGDGRIRAWQLRNHTDDGAILASGTGAGVITFAPVSLRKITFVILSANGTPRVAEYRTFAG